MSPAPQIDPAAVNTPTPPPASAPQRDGKGHRYAAGNRGGPGNPFARQVGALRKTYFDYMTAQRFDALVAKRRRSGMAVLGRRRG